MRAVRQSSQVLLAGLLLAAGVWYSVPPAGGDEAVPQSAPPHAAAPKSAAKAPVTGVKAPAKPAASERIGAEVCLQCHTYREKGWYTLRHNRYRTSSSAPEMLQGCEGCHGSGEQHLEDEKFGHILNPAKTTGLKAVAMCFQCHETTMKATAWLQTSHARSGMQCGTCHEVHGETKFPAMLKQESTKLCLSCHQEQESTFKMNSHHPVLEGRMACIDCHNPHVDNGAAAGALKTGGDMCLKCHQDKRGPFAFEHQTTPEGGDANCLSCHKPHGSPNPRLASYFGRGVCLQCHSDIAADPKHVPRVGNCWQAGCHNRMHGSNTDRWFIN